MKLNKISLFTGLAILMTTSSTILPMDAPKIVQAAKKFARWANVVGSMLTGETSIGNAQAQLTIPNDPVPFDNLPKDIQRNIIFLLSMYTSAASLKDAAQTINVLAQTNKYLNELINDRHFCLQLIKNLAKRFNCADFVVSGTLQTRQAKIQHRLQQELLDLCTNRHSLNEKQLGIKLLQLYSKGVDVNFTYHDEQSTPLIIAAYVTPVLAFHLLDTPGIDPELANKNGTTPLDAAKEELTPNKELIARIEEEIVRNVLYAPEGQ